MTAFAIRNICKSFGGNAILKDISISAEPGEFIALVGPSGCGKSTLLRIIAGLDQADAGQISIGGRDVTEAGPADRNVAMVFQSYALYPHLTAGENIAVPLAMCDLNTRQRLPVLGRLLPGTRTISADIKSRVRETAVTLQIEHLLDRKPGQMSGGQRQRVALARALVRRPAVFLMDEPLSNLDANLRVHARGEIVDLHRRAGVPTIYVTHDQAEALSMADRVAVMIGGHLLQLASPQAIYEDPAHLDVARFVGSPRINLISATVDTGGFARSGDVALIGVRGMLPGTAITLGIRPEFLRLRTPGTNTLDAVVERLEFLGSEVLVFARPDGATEASVAKLTPAEAAGIAPGQRVALGFEPANVLIFAPDGQRIRQPAAARRPEAAHV